MQRQKIRPSFAELQGQDDDFDNQDDEPESDDGVPEYAPAATSYRGVPPPIIASSSKGPAMSSSSSKGTASAPIESTVKSKTVRIAPSSKWQVHEIEGRSIQTPRVAERSRRPVPSEGPERFRFDLDEEIEDDDKIADSKKTRLSQPLIGTIQERVGLRTGTNSKPAEKRGISKYAQAKKQEKKAEAVSSKADMQEEWLDEDGEPMSAFRKAILFKQGKRPPALTARSKVDGQPKEVAAPPKEISKAAAVDPLMQAISQENEAKISAMSAKEMEQSLQDLQDTFGVEMLEKLKRRRERKKALDGESDRLALSAGKEQDDNMTNSRILTQEEIRSRYFPTESKDLPTSLQWTKETEMERSHQPDDISTLRFDFSGKLISESALLGQDTHSAGLHHHGDDQDRAGYSLEELLHLARSTLPSQCIIALQTLERIFFQYRSKQNSGIVSEEESISKHLKEERVRGKAAVIASWYIEDRQVSVRSAAMRCLDACTLSDIMQALILLPKGQEKAALNLINVILPSKVDVATHLATMTPFINEMLRVPRHHQSNTDDESLDPLSGIELWQSNSTGLPLRPDWPFLALEDLLHSGNCASLNRKNALSSNWDANERQIVTASLDLGLLLWNKVMLESPEIIEVLPSSAEVHIAIIKVFMLEEDQSQGGKATGLITGRDLFRDDRIGQLLAALFDLAKRLDHLPRSKDDDMEKAATRHFGSSLPFYQLYTSFIGLYDSISFGMELFGRALLTAQSDQYASDYRRLLWIDYGHCLSTIQTTVSQAPISDLKCFLCSDIKDDGILQAMVNALLRRSVTIERNELLFQIAVQQVGHTIWCSEDDSRKRLAEVLFKTESGQREVQDAIMQYGIAEGEAAFEERQDRQKWLDDLSR
jgi:hypothetical protein